MRSSALREKARRLGELSLCAAADTGAKGSRSRSGPLAEGVDIRQLADLTDALSRADIAEAYRPSALMAPRRVRFAETGAEVISDDLRSAITMVNRLREKAKPRIGFRVERDEEKRS